MLFRSGIKDDDFDVATELEKPAITKNGDGIALSESNSEDIMNYVNNLM